MLSESLPPTSRDRIVARSARRERDPQSATGLAGYACAGPAAMGLRRNDRGRADSISAHHKRKQGRFSA